ncbi:MAG: peroxidase family protein, partial [Solirubrobacteraceae bacterium]
MPYLRLTFPRYADGIGAMEGGPSPRYVSNRIFNSLGVDLFSARYVSQWGWVWGQFLDHTMGLARTGSVSAPIPFDPTDPLESYHNATGSIAF